jgi:malate permease and related proteins
VIHFLHLIAKLAPAYGYVIFGYVAKRFGGIPEQRVAKVLFFVLIPLVVFKGALFSSTDRFAILAVLSFLCSIGMAGIGHRMRSRFADVTPGGVLMCLFAYFNIGWFGIPVVYAIWGNAAALVMTALYVGGMLFGNTVGYALIASDAGGARGAVTKLSRVPALYAVVLALLLRQLGCAELLADSGVVSGLLDLATLFTSILGMALVGMSVVTVDIQRVAWGRLAALLVTRILAAAVLVGSLSVILEALGVLSPLEAKILRLLPCLPIAANMLVFVAKDRGDVRLVGVALLTSTVLSCFLLVGLLALG